MKRALLALTAWLAAAPASAVLQPVDLFAPGDALSTYDTETGLEWLDLDQTRGYSVAGILAGLGGWAAAGWRPATASEVCALLNGYAAPLDPCPRLGVADVAPAPQIDAFIALLEPTLVYEIERPIGSGTLVQALLALGYFEISESEVGLAGVLDANAAWVHFSYEDRAVLFAEGGHGPPGTSAGEFGVFVVRPLPEPGAAAQLAAGCAALVALARRSRPA